MSEQGFKGVPGVPEGWELVAVRHAKPSDWYLGRDGEPQMWTQSCQSNLVYCIIRKIEKPKKYRPFANGEEFKPHRDRWVKVVSEDNSGGLLDEGDTGGLRSITGCSKSGVCIWEGWMTYGEAFECFAFDDGTPFGVEVTE